MHGFGDHGTIEAYVDFITGRIHFFRARAAGYKAIYYSTRGLGGLLAALLPLIAQSADCYVVFAEVKLTALIAAIIAFLAAVELFIRPGELWRHNRLYERRLESEWWSFYCAASGQRDTAARTFFTATQQTIRDEVDKYWSTRPLDRSGPPPGSEVPT